MYSELDHIFKDNVALNHDYRSVNIQIFSPFFSFIPETIFHQDAQKAFINYTVSIPSHHTILKDKLDHLGIFNLYAIPNKHHDFFSKHFTKANFHHSASNMISYVLDQYREEKDTQVYISREPETVEFIAQKEGAFVLYNSFDVTNPEDMLYYTLLVYDQLELNKEKDKLIVLGRGSRTSKEILLLSQYVAKIDVEDVSFNLQLPSALKNIKLSNFYNLFCGI